MNEIYSYDVLYVLCQCAVRTDQSEILYVCTCVCMYVVVLVFFPWCKAAGVCHSPVSSSIWHQCTPLPVWHVWDDFSLWSMSFESLCTFKNLLCETVKWKGEKLHIQGKIVFKE